MDLEIRSVTAEEIQKFVHTLGLGFGEIAPGDQVSTWAPLLDPQRCLAAFDGEDMVGGAAAVTLDITVPGAILPSGAVIGAAVLPTHRRRGLLRALMERHLHDMHDRGQVLGALWASEYPIYGRFGYGVGTQATAYEIDPAHAAFAPLLRAAAPPGRIQLHEGASSLGVAAPVYQRFRSRQVGAVARPELWWPHLFNDRDYRRGEFSPMLMATYASAAGTTDGYVLYRIKEGEDGDGLAAAEVRILDLISDTDEAYAALWRFCLDIDLVVKVHAGNRPIDDPVLHLLADGRRLRRRVTDGMWIRLIDVPGALEGRTYRSAGALTLRVLDAVCPWNDATFRLEAGPRGATCTPTGHDPDLELGVDDLAGAYLGTASLSGPARAGRVRVLTEGALATADTLFGWAPAPWCPNVF